MAFSKQHYIAIARIIATAEQHSIATQSGLIRTVDKAELVSELSKLFAQDNARFDETRFIDACYP